MAINLRGAFVAIREAARVMIAQGEGGRIVNIASVDAVAPEPRFSHYDASKGGLVALTRSLALELGPPSEHAVRLTAAPMVEGLVAAVVRAAGGADLETVAREAEAALLPKVVSLAEHTPLPALVAVEADVSARLMLVNPQGLHARPAAQIATAVGGLSAEVAVESGGRRADASSSLELMTLGAGQGTEITVSAVGADAEQAVAAVREMVEAGFGELEAS